MAGRWRLVGLLIVAALAMWLLLAGPSRLLGIATGKAGMVLLLAAAWGALYAIHRLPRGELETAVSPGEWRSWIGLGFMAVSIAYFLSKSHVFAGARSLFDNPDATAVGRNLVMLLIAWAVVSQVLQNRWQGQIQEDERDRAIEELASAWGRGALTFCIFGLAVMFGFSPADRLRWATPVMIGNLLVFSLMWSFLVEHAVTAGSYWRDRH